MPTGDAIRNKLTGVLRRSSEFDRLNQVLQNAVGLDLTRSPDSWSEWLDDLEGIPGEIDSRLNSEEGINFKEDFLALLGTSAVGNVAENIVVLTKALREGTDPNDGGSTTTALQDLRDEVEAAGAPAYSGDAQNDEPADIFKYIIDQGFIT